MQKTPGSSHKYSIVLRRLPLVLLTIPTVAYLVFCFFYPVVSLVWRGLADADLAGLTNESASDPFSALTSVLGSPATLRALRTTLTLAFAGTLCSVLLGLPLAWALYCLRYRGQNILRTLVMVPFVLPTIGVASAFKALFSEEGWFGFLHIEGSFWSVVIAMVFYNASLIARTVGPVWVRLDPRLYEAARSLGAGPVRAWFNATLARLWGPVCSSAALVFLYCAGSYSLVMILGGLGVVTLERLIYDTINVNLNFPAASIQAILQIVVAVVALLVSQFFQGRAARSTRLAPVERTSPLSSKHVPGFLTVVALIFVLFFLPIAQVVAASLRRQGHYTLANYRDLFSDQATNVISQPAISAVGVSFKTSLWGAFIAVGLGAIVASLTAYPWRSSSARGLARTFDTAYTLPLGVSSVVVGLGFLITLVAPPWNLADSIFLLPLAQALGAIPLVVRVIQPLLQSIDPRQRWVAASLGAGPLLVWRDVDWPYLAQGLAVAAGYAFAVCFGEFGAASFLVLPDRPTLPVMIYRLSRTGGINETGMALALAVILSLVNALVMALVESARGRKRSLKS